MPEVEPALRETEERKHRRFRWWWLVLVVGLGFAIHLLLPQVGQLRNTLEALDEAHPLWLFFTLVSALGTYVAAAWALQGSTSFRIPFWRTMCAQIAGSFANRLAPGALGGMALNSRYLQREGMPTGGVAAAIATNQGAGLILHIGMLILALYASGIRGVGEEQTPPQWPILIAVVVVLALAGTLFFPAVRRRLAEPVRDARRELKALARSPRQALLLFGGCLGVTVFYSLALFCALNAFGADAPIERVALAYLIASAIGSASPTPGGLGAVEAALLTALTFLGVASGPAIAGILAYRLATFWLPIIPGAICFRGLRKRGHL